MLKYHDLIASLRHGDILPLYLFYGEEEFLISEALDLIIKKVVEPGSRDFNFNTLYCRDTQASDIVNLALTLPFMTEKRLVIAKDFDALKAADLEELIAYLNEPSPSTCLVMVSNQGKYDKKSVVAAVEARGAVTRFFPLLDREIVSWIEAWAKERGLSLSRDAAQYLGQTIGNDLAKISSELEKIEIYIRDRRAITFDDVKAVVGDFREYTTFDLAAALGLKNREKALLILSRLLQEGEQPVALLGSIAWNFRRLIRAKCMQSAGIGYEEIKRKLNVIFHQSELFQEQMRRFSVDELRDDFDVMLSADKALKSSGLPGRLVLERMILKLCGSA
ncbi:MAG TPA: DNA polymerase III subunit delta [Nitrospirota bacterium]|nr:DNA polymerase III subunit delta [Nitrospirota bacterium]